MKTIFIGVIFSWFFTGWLISLIRWKVWEYFILHRKGEMASGKQFAALLVTFPFQMFCILWERVINGYGYGEVLPFIPNLSPMGFGSAAPLGMMEDMQEREGIVFCALGKKKSYTRYTVLGIPVEVPWDAQSFFLMHRIDSILIGLLHIPFYFLWLVITIIMGTLSIPFLSESKQ